MTLTELKYIVALSEEKHFGKAAERCHVSQPTLSVAVKKLEEELGVVLFERSKSLVTVTELGSKIIDQSSRVLNEVSVIQDIVQEGRDPLSAPLKLGAIYTIGPYLFPHLVPEIRRVAPKMPLYVEENYTAVLSEKLKSSKLDACIIALPYSEPEVLTLPLYDEPFVILVPKNHPLSKKKLVSADDLLSDNLLMLGPGHCFRDQLLEACPQIEQAVGQKYVKKSDSDGRLITEGSSLETIKQMVATGFGISVLPLSAATGPSNLSELVEVKHFTAPVPSRTVALAWRVTFPRTKAIDTIALAANQCRIPG